MKALADTTPAGGDAVRPVSRLKVNCSRTFLALLHYMQIRLTSSDQGPGPLPPMLRILK